ncbi:hypothetical protein [Streptomyces zagrosensis]|uniref:DNA-directed RNA polymerase specialized sigma24 family protein n=1 Tax=Streptomyces zagrosensis TaxID=1042984 RepID=A0A7W9Q747_9ACTN|nr:hypothetical protein [Streptomyces zagrosensis]MBB5934761.1 DNA-directed RNA polymerase specialized sigma24 family protein [Streptomyces zagrosensis]
MGTSAGARPGATARPNPRPSTGRAASLAPGIGPLTSPSAAFDALYAHHASALIRQAYLLTGKPQLAEEAVEYAFQLAWQRWPEVAVDHDPAGWIRAAAYEFALSPWHRLRPERRKAPPATPPPPPQQPPQPGQSYVGNGRKSRSAAKAQRKTQDKAQHRAGEKGLVKGVRRHPDTDSDCDASSGASRDTSSGNGSRQERWARAHHDRRFGSPTDAPPAPPTHHQPGARANNAPGAQPGGRSRPRQDKPSTLRRAMRRAAIETGPGAAAPGDPALLSALLSLPHSYRRTLLLYDGVGLDLPETAAETEASTPATAGRLMHARQALVERLPELRRVPPEQLGAVLHQRLGVLAVAQPVRIRAAELVRSGSERTTTLLVRAAVGLTALIAAATALTLATTSDSDTPATEPTRSPVTTRSPGESAPGAPSAITPATSSADAPRPGAERPRAQGDTEGGEGDN